MASFIFLPVSDYLLEISSPKATKSRAVGPFTTNDVFVYRNIHRKRSKKVKKGHKYHLFMSFARFRRAVGLFTTSDEPKVRLCRFRRRRRRSTSRRPVYLRRGCNISSPKATIDGPKARLPTSTVQIFRHRRRRNHGL